MKDFSSIKADQASAVAAQNHGVQVADSRPVITPSMRGAAADLPAGTTQAQYNAAITPRRISPGPR